MYLFGYYPVLNDAFPLLALDACSSDTTLASAGDVFQSCTLGYAPAPPAE